MFERRYKVIVGSEVVATDMDLMTATILIRAILQEYAADPNLSVTIKEMPKTADC